MTYTDNNSSYCCFYTSQHYNNYLTCLCDVNIVYCQPVCHYVMPLLSGIKTNAM